MNYLDIIMVIFLLYAIIKGFANGLIKEVTNLTGLTIGAYVAINFSSYLYPKVSELLLGYEEFVPIIAFATLFLVSVLIIWILGNILDRLTKILALGLISKILGSIFGGLKIIIISSFALVFLTKGDLIKQETQEESVLLGPLDKVSEYIIPKVNKHKSRILDKIEKTETQIENQIKSQIKIQEKE